MTGAGPGLKAVGGEEGGMHGGLMGGWGNPPVWGSHKVPEKRAAMAWVMFFRAVSTSASIGALERSIFVLPRRSKRALRSMGVGRWARWVRVQLPGQAGEVGTRL